MHLTGWNPNVTLDLSLIDNRIIIDYVMNRAYILTASKRQQIQVNYLLNLRYEFKYPMMVNIIKYDEILFYTFATQTVNHLSPYSGFRLPLLQEQVLSTFCCIYSHFNSDHPFTPGWSSSTHSLLPIFFYWCWEKILTNYFNSVSI